MQTLQPPPQPQQLALGLAIDPELLDAKAREIFEHSRYLSGKYASFSKLMADPLLARCMRFNANLLLQRAAERTRGH